MNEKPSDPQESLQPDLSNEQRDPIVDSIYYLRTIVEAQQEEITALKQEIIETKELAQANKERQRKGLGQILFGFIAIGAVVAPLFTLQLTGEFALGNSRNKYQFQPLNPEILAKACSSSVGTGVLLLFFTGKKELVEEWLLAKSGIKYQK